MIRRVLLKNNSYKRKYIRTDLACESGRISPDKYKSAVYSRIESDGVITERLFVPDEDAEKETGKSKGSYTTVYAPQMKNYYLKDDRAKEVLCHELCRMAQIILGQSINSSTKALVAGLGNRFITADSLGPRTADKIHATRHAKGAIPAFEKLGCSDVSVIHTGVLGQTGIESGELIKGTAKKVRPDIIIAIDALAARSPSRLATTVQLSDTGISPGAGIGNKRKAINSVSVGCPVIAIGVPTIVDSSTLIYDALERGGVNEISQPLKKILDNSKSFFVSLNDCDMVTEFISDIISYAINKAFGTHVL